MTDQAAAKKILSDLVKREDLKNKVCNDCPNPNPQWASLSFAVFICLQCAGIHRGFGVHVSFVRSISMDTWQDEQIRRMQLGGNGPFRDFMNSYTPAAQGGYSDDLSIHDKYHCWAASQYREKLDADLAGKPWSPSPPQQSSTAPPGRPSSAQGLRKSRTSGRSLGSSLRGDSESPAPTSSMSDLGMDQKTANEHYFANLGRLNESRPADLPPSQGGRYQGFGSTPTPHPSNGLSSAAAPSLTDFQEDPKAALSKGWSLLSTVVLGASRAINESVIQPGVEKVTDPNFQANVKGYVSEAQKKAAQVGSSANQWSKQQFGVDVAESVGGVVDSVKDRIGAGPSRSGYGALSTGYDGETSQLYHDDDDFFDDYRQNPSPTTPAPTSSAGAGAPGHSTNAKNNSGWDDDWKDF